MPIIGCRSCGELSFRELCPDCARIQELWRELLSGTVDPVAYEQRRQEYVRLLRQRSH